MKRVPLNPALLLAAACITLLTACTGTRMASRPLTAQEQEWAENLQRWHPDWRQPYLTPTRPTEPTADTLPPAAPPFLWEQPIAPETPGPGLLLEPPVDVGAPAEDFVLVPVEADADAPEPTQTYEVQKGDTLSHISLKFYGKAQDWRRIWESNRDILEAPEKLKPGMVLRIPPAE
jgi:nucleoid-associated protein YgaU